MKWSGEVKWWSEVVKWSDEVMMTSPHFSFFLMTDLLINTVEIIHREVLEQTQRTDILCDCVNDIYGELKDLYQNLKAMLTRIDDLEASLNASNHSKQQKVNE